MTACEVSTQSGSGELYRSSIPLYLPGQQPKVSPALAIKPQIYGLGWDGC